jgi:hypothetical protein
MVSADGQKFGPQLSETRRDRFGMVRDRGFEPLTPTVSR